MTNAVSQSMGSFSISLARLRLEIACHVAFARKVKPLVAMPCSMMGLDIPNPVGIAAGLDRTGRLCGLVSSIGFGFIEIGSVTPANLDPTLTNLAHWSGRKKSGIIGVNIACLRNATAEQAIKQILYSSRACAQSADYIVVNLSSPFTTHVRKTGRQWFETLLGELAVLRQSYKANTGENLALAVKVLMKQSVRCNDNALEILQIAQTHQFDGAIVATSQNMEENCVLENLAQAKRIIAGMTLVSVGGITCATQVRSRIKNGAQAVQMFTGTVMRGPSIAKRIVSGLAANIANPHSSLRGDK